MNQAPPTTRQANQHRAQLALVLVGIIAGQAVLYGPSLIGRKVLLPLKVLALPGVYLPRTPKTARIASVNIFLPDAIYAFEPARRYAVSEVQAGRWPMWMPYQYGGAPFTEPKFSPFALLQFSTGSPVILAWSQMAVALVAGLGAYWFFRQGLGLSFWPSAFAAWCYPLTAFFIFWQGYFLSLTACWLPWLLLCVDATVRGSSRFAPLGLALTSCLTLISGQLDVAGQALLASGLYALWRLAHQFHGQLLKATFLRTTLSLAVAWLLGLLLAAPQILPVWDYAKTGDRMTRRSAGEEERPPVGIAALPQTVLPDMYGGYGIWSLSNFRFAKGNQLESSAAAYTGFFATLLIAPLAWCSRRHGSMNWFWLLAALFGLSWCLNLPGFVWLLRLPGLKMMSHNRLVFFSSFAILALAATGLEVLAQRLLERRWWLGLIPAMLILLAGFCLYRARFLPEPLATQLEARVRDGGSFLWVRDLAGVRLVQSWFVRYYSQAAVCCLFAVLGWLVLWARQSWQQRILPLAGAVLVLDLLSFAYGRSLQCDPALYYPPIQILRQVAQAQPGRIIGYQCLPPNAASLCGLTDIRGYDGVDPARMLDLLRLAADPASPNVDYARAAFLLPKLAVTSGGELRLPPVLDLLGVRYVIFRQMPFKAAQIAFHDQDYWVMTNRSVLPRAFIPRKTEAVPDNETRLRNLSSDQFDPRAVAYTESPLPLPAECRGSVEIVRETPTRIELSTQMETAGLVVLADRWDKGWQARLNGQRVPILIADHALRGVMVPAGTGTLEFVYWPTSFALGLKLCAPAAVLCFAWFCFRLRNPPQFASLAPLSLGTSLLALARKKP
jgi:hypothetical protein